LLQEPGEISVRQGELSDALIGPANLPQGLDIFGCPARETPSQSQGTGEVKAPRTETYFVMTHANASCATSLFGIKQRMLKGTRLTRARGRV
jgi:hypothetical protein